MRPIEIPALNEEDLKALEALYHKTRDVRIRMRAQMILLAAEKRMVAAVIAEIVRVDEETVRRWMKRYQAEGLEGLYDVPRTGARVKVTEAYRQVLLHVVRHRPRSLEQPFSMWTLQRLAEYLAEQTGIRVEAETIRLHLKAGGIVLSRPQHTVTSPDPEYVVKKRRLKQPVMALLQEFISTLKRNM